MLLLVPPQLADSVKKMTIPMASQIIVKYAVESKRNERFKKAISELRSFQCDGVLTKEQLKEVVLILKECGITDKDFKKLMKSFADYPYEGWFHKIRQAKKDPTSGLAEYLDY